MTMLSEIRVLIPNNEMGRLLVEFLCELFSNLDYADGTKEKIVLGNKDMYPKIAFYLSDEVDTICVDFGQEDIKFFTRTVESNYDVKRHSAGVVLKKLKGHIVRIDHVGFNAPSMLYSKDEWNSLIKNLSFKCNLYSYPTGEPWPFILPSNIEEHEGEIENFNLVREPRFELVYDDYTDKNTIQIDLGVDMTKEEVEKLFPGDDGIYVVGLENILKCIYVDFGFTYDFRLDIRYKSNRDIFSTGEWFVKEGKRVR